MSLGAQDFERWWPEVARRLARSLARQGMTSDDAEDVVQETALRALAAAPPVASAEELARWSYTVARRISIDRARRRGRSELLAAELASLRPTGTDTARAAEGRVNLAVAARGLATLSDTDRSALLSVLDEGTAAAAVVDRRAAVRDAVRRHRARLRLVAAVGKLVGVGVAAAQGLRRVVGRVRPAYAEAGLAALAAGVLLLGPSGSRPAIASPSVAPDSPAPASGSLAPAPPASASKQAVARPARPVRAAAPPSATQVPTPPADGGDRRPPTSIPVGPSYSYLPVFTSDLATVDPNRALVCAFNDPDVDCMQRAVRVKGTNL